MGMTRAEKVAEAARLRGEGLSYPQIGERLGVNQGTAYKWLNPDRQKVYAKRDWESPEGKERRRRWRETAAPCPDCGGKVSDPRQTRCWRCEGAHREAVARARCGRFIALRREGLTNRQIAEREGVPDHVVAQQLHRAHSKYGLEVPPPPYWSRGQVAA